MSCPKCNSIHQKRKKRNFFMKLLPNNKLYKCYDCKAVYISFFGKLKMVLKRPIVRNNKKAIV